MPSLRSLLAFALLAATSVDAGGFGRESKNWGCDNSKASTVEKRIARVLALSTLIGVP